MLIVREKNQNNGNFDELSIFFELIIAFNQTRQAKVKRGEKVPPPHQ